MKLAKVLLVEDSHPDVEWFRRFFHEELLCNEIDVAANYNEALSRIKSGEVYDIIVMDLSIPGNGGLEIVRKIKNAPHHEQTAIVVLSGSDAWADFSEARALGVRAYAVKPITAASWKPVMRELHEFCYGLMRREVA